jgi:hypothetical protein
MEATMAVEDLLCARMMTSPLMMPFVQAVLFSMHLLILQETQVVCCEVHPCFGGHTLVAIVMEAMTVAEDLLCMRMMTLPLMMPFVQGTLFDMLLLNLQDLR